MTQFLNCTKSLVSKYNNFIFDCDGVLWNSSSSIARAQEFLALLNSQNKQIFFLTNNGMSTRDEYQLKIMKLLEYETQVNRIYTSSYIVAQYIKQKHPELKTAFVLGREVLVAELESAGLKVTGGSEHDDKYTIDYNQIRSTPLENNADLVVCSFDYMFNLYKLAMASYGVQNGAVFLATNPDKYTKSPCQSDKLFPGFGSLLSSIETACDKKAIVTGKPNVFALETVLTNHNLKKEETLFIGDNLMTDILCSNNAQIDSLLVYTGVTRQGYLQEQSEKPEGEGVPTYCSDDLGYQTQ